MADQKISDLSAASLPLTGAELIELVQGGSNKQATVADIAHWALAGTTAAAGSAGTGAWNYASDVGEVIFTGLDNYSEIMILFRQITKSGGGGVVSLTVSIDNGANFLTSSGDYVQVADTGVETNAALVNLHSTSATAARSGTMTIQAWRLTAPKVYNVTTRTSVTGTSGYIPTANALNALRLFSAGVNFTGGSIRIYGR